MRGWSLLQSGSRRTSLGVFLTEFQAMRPCLSCPLAQPGVAWWFPVPPGPLRLPPGSPAVLPPTLQSPNLCRAAPPPHPGLLHPGSFVLDDLRRYSVDLRYTVSQTTGSVPISTVIISEATGSRTILHAYRFVCQSAPCQPPLSPSLTLRTGSFSQRPTCSSTPSPSLQEVQATYRL